MSEDNPVIGPQTQEDTRAGYRLRMYDSKAIADRLQAMCYASARARVDVAQVDFWTEHGVKAYVISLSDLRKIYHILSGNYL